MKSVIQDRLTKYINKEEKRVERIFEKKISKLISGNIEAIVYIDREAYSGHIRLDTTIKVNNDGVHMLINNRGIHVLSTNLSEGTVNNIKQIVEPLVFQD